MRSHLESWARYLLHAATLEEKLISLPRFMEAFAQAPILPDSLPLFPSRPGELRKRGKVPFPKISTLHRAEQRGAVFHFFANHELLALELMALQILRFPGAPIDFINGLAATIEEEQAHLKSYINQMNLYGVSFGDLPLNDFFWRVMSRAESPAHFMAQMSLTFEQANLDYCKYYQSLFQLVGDEPAGALLEKVYEDEIGHVKHGLKWFRQWCPIPSPDHEWREYCKLLPSQLSPSRAKGIVFDFVSRERVGFSREYIESLEHYEEHVSQPTRVFHFNPNDEWSVLQSSSGFSSKGIHAMEHFMMYLCEDPRDCVLVHQRPEMNWLKKMRDRGFCIPQFITTMPQKKIQYLPWSRKRAHDELSSKSWSLKFYRDWLHLNPSLQEAWSPLEDLGDSQDSIEKIELCIPALLEKGAVLLKSPFGASGLGLHKITSFQEYEKKKSQGVVHRILREQRHILVQPYLNRLADVSIQLDVLEDAIIFHPARQFFVSKNFQYQGTRLGGIQFETNSDLQKYFYAILPTWKKCLADLAAALRKEGYRGPMGVDAFLYEKEGKYRFKAISEINLRMTMGRIALGLEKHCDLSKPAFWVIFNDKKKEKLSSLQSVGNWKNNRYLLQKGFFETSDLSKKAVFYSGLIIDEAETAQALFTN